MKKILFTIFDLIFPRRKNDAAIINISPQDFYEKIPRWHGEIYPDIKAIFRYKNPTAKAMIKEFKSSKNRHAVEIAAFALANHLEENDISDAIIIPMPISEKRREKRGYNQCEFLAEFLIGEIKAREIGIGTTNMGILVRTDMLLRPVDTAKFAFENRTSRMKAALGIFKANCPLPFLEKRMIVIDDVITTGSTMMEAIGTLRRAGAKNVSGIGIAH